MMTDTPSSIVVLLAAYNGERYIREQLDSILVQEGVCLSVVISVDESDDDTLAIVQTYQVEYPTIVNILPYGKRYGSAGSNFARLLNDTELKPYKYISFADQDDIWLPRKLIQAIAEIEARHVDGYSANVTAFWAEGNERLIKKNFKQVKYDYLFESSGPGCTFVLNYRLAQSLKDHIILNTDRLALMWLHDWFCYSFARSNNFSWFIDSKPAMKYRQHASNEVGANVGLKGFISRWRVLMSGDGFAKVVAQAAFIGQEDSYPIQLIKSKHRMSMLKLLLVSRQCRRQKLHKLVLAIICFIFFIKGCDYDVLD
jgi:rhamnosyltransferase